MKLEEKLKRREMMADLEIGRIAEIEDVLPVEIEIEDVEMIIEDLGDPDPEAGVEIGGIIAIEEEIEDDMRDQEDLTLAQEVDLTRVIERNVTAHIEIGKKEINMISE